MKTLYRSVLLPATLLLALVLGVGCDSTAQEEQTPTASLTGTVLEKDNQTPLSGISVKLGATETATDPNGRYAFRDLAVGRMMQLRIAAPGFEDFLENVTVQEGDNRRDILLARTNLYSHDTGQGRFRMYLPPGVTTYRSVLFFVAPPTVEARGFVNGTRLTHPNPPNSEALPRLNEQATGLREWALEHAVENYGTALLGANLNMPTSRRTADDVLETLTQIAQQSGHPELAQAPLLVVGMSAGACFAYDFTRYYSSQVLGFIAQKGSCLAFDAGSARDVPGYFFIGETDTDVDNSVITQVFEYNRQQGALWALASEPEAGHVAVGDINLITSWINTVLERRLPESIVPGSPVTLNGLDETSGWLGDRQTFEIAEFEQYDGDPLQASWLPTMQTAQDWQVFVSRGEGG